MASSKAKPVQFRRKREGRTDYKKRLRLLMGGKARVVLRFSNQRVTAQIVRFEVTGDKVVVGTNSVALQKMGWNYSLKSLPATYLCGALLAQKAQAAGFNEEVILDTGFLRARKKGKVYAFVKGAVDAGLALRVGSDEDLYPAQERLDGSQIVAYAKSLQSENPQGYERQFAAYLKTKADPAAMNTTFVKLQKQLGATQ